MFIYQPISLFLRRDVNKAFARVTGGKVNRGAGYGLEIQCVYQFYGPKPYIDKLREVIDSLKTSGLYIQVVIVYVGVSKIFVLVRYLEIKTRCENAFGPRIVSAVRSLEVVVSRRLPMYYKYGIFNL